MARILVFNNDTDRMEVYTRAESDPMPYNTNGTLRVREFRGSSKSNILWTTKRTMQAWNSQRYAYGAPIPVGFAFKRPYEGGHGNQSQYKEPFHLLRVKYLQNIIGWNNHKLTTFA